MKNFKQKIVVITGAGSGMGRAYAMAFARLGARVALNDYSETGLGETVQLVKARYPDAVIYSRAFDVGDRDAMYAFADEVKQTLGNAHVIINNAGMSGGGVAVTALDDQLFDRTLQVNFFGVVYGTRAFLPQLEANQEGAIINVSSVFGFIGTPGSSAYCASKFAVRGFTESLMVELYGSPISVHLVHPGGIKTNIASQSGQGQAFAERFLKTDAMETVNHVIERVMAGQPRIVYGYRATQVWLASWMLPLKLRNRLIYRQMMKLAGSRTSSSH